MRRVSRHFLWVRPVGTLAFFISWAVLGNMWKGKETNFTRIATIALVLLVIGLITTVPPFWHLFIAE